MTRVRGVHNVVATGLAACGIDVRGISHSIGCDLPADSETYVHRIRPTRRAGAKGIGITLVALAVHRDVSMLADTLGLDHGLCHPTAGSSPGSSENPARARHRPSRRRTSTRG